MSLLMLTVVGSSDIKYKITSKKTKPFNAEMNRKNENIYLEVMYTNIYWFSRVVLFHAALFKYGSEMFRRSTYVISATSIYMEQHSEM
jgi:hypothetical protein